MDIKKDNRVVLTLDAGGTNFVFSAIEGGEEIVKPVILPASSTDLNKCLTSISQGFQEIIININKKPSAISFVLLPCFTL